MGQIMSRPFSGKHAANKLKELCDKSGISHLVKMQIQGIIDRRAEDAFLKGVEHCHQQYKKKDETTNN